MFILLKKIRAILLLTLFSTSLANAAGGVQVLQTRVIFNEGDKSALTTVRNNGDAPYLVKSDVLTTLDETASNANNSPFILTPPIARLEANSENALRILRQPGKTLPKDRESVYYLSFLAIPSSGKNEQDSEGMVAGKMTVGLQLIIKLFYRPEGLTELPAEAPSKLTFQRVAGGVKVNNPTPYHVTFSELKVGNKVVEVDNVGAMVAPFEQKTFKHEIGTATTVTWQGITDLGDVTKVFTSTIGN
ncbi:molecular chaperone [Providencia rettgeri]|nr:molecular chaperone [Providencia rettgeri]